MIQGGLLPESLSPLVATMGDRVKVLIGAYQEGDSALILTVNDELGAIK